jgi:hypothetical protein
MYIDSRRSILAVLFIAILSGAVMAQAPALKSITYHLSMSALAPGP